jgi:hypothetical protein
MKTRKDTSLAEGVVVVLGTGLFLGALIIPTVLINAFVVQHLYNWFIPHIFDVSTIGFWAASGLSLVVGYLTYTDTTNLSKNKEGVEALLEVFANAWVVRPAFALGIGWIIHQLAF